jgi:hypothetical protein
MCSNFDDLEFLREVITKRIKESRSLKKSLSLVATHPEKEHKLYVCNDCGQQWQGSRAWNWGNDEYLFRVPVIDAAAWKDEVFVQPDELLIFTAVLSEILKRGEFKSTKDSCRVEGCGNLAVSGSVQCLRHHIESLQVIRAAPAYPSGRWFGPYVRENIVPAL